MFPGCTTLQRYRHINISLPVPAQSPSALDLETIAWVHTRNKDKGSKEIKQQQQQQRRKKRISLGVLKSWMLSEKYLRLNKHHKKLTFPSH
jgi:hypothetical protein